MTTNTEIFKDEPLRYPNPRSPNWMSNNGFRRRWLSIGQVHADAMNAARAGDAEPALTIVKASSTLTQPKTFAKSLLRLAKTLPADVPGYRIGDGRVCIAQLNWRYDGHGHQVATFKYLSLWGLERPAERAA